MRNSWKVVKLATAGLAFMLFLGGCAPQDINKTQSQQTEAAVHLTGSKGAVEFDDGVIVLGSGEKVVDLFIDPICPYCKMFEETSGPELFAAAESGTVTLRIHPLAILDRLSRGTRYSTRASAVLTAVAAEYPKHVVAFLAAMYGSQPKENTPGLSESALFAMANEVGAPLDAPGAQARPDLGSYEAWIEAHTQSSLVGPLSSTTELAAIQAVPTVVVDGSVYKGESSDSERFSQFLNGK